MRRNSGYGQNGPYRDLPSAGAIGMLTALSHRKINGCQGQVIDAALHEAIFNLMESLFPKYSALATQCASCANAPST